MPCGIKVEVVQGIDFLQVVNTTLYATTMDFSKGLFTLERVGSSPKAQVVPYLEDEGHWKRGTFPKTRKLEMGCG
jgi:hypothetical protein